MDAITLENVMELMMALQALGLDVSQFGQYVDPDEGYAGLVPQGYSLEFMYPYDIGTGVWEMLPPFADPRAVHQPGAGGRSTDLVGSLVVDAESPAIGPDTPHAVEGERAYTLRDEIDKYLIIAPGSAEQEALAETLWSNNFYSDGVTRDEMLRPRNIDSAFRLGIEWGARQGVSIWDMGEGPGRDDKAAPALTEASIYYTAELAAKESFGRSATPVEKQIALTISRALEAAGVPVSRSDIAAELEAGAPGEVRQRDMSTTLRYLMKAMAGRGAS